ncbi:hypothetical protein ACSTJ1_00310, partial [Vibrio parahaemolyticus]
MTRRREPPYRITLVDHRWHVRRPHATMDHAFDKLEDAVAFVQRDSAGEATIVELMVGNAYMVKQKT